MIMLLNIYDYVKYFAIIVVRYKKKICNLYYISIYVVCLHFLFIFREHVWKKDWTML